LEEDAMAYVDVSCASCGHQSSVDATVAARMKNCPACNAELPPPTSAASAAPAASAAAPPEPPATEHSRRRLFLRREALAATPTSEESGPAKPVSDAPTGGAAASPAEPILRIDRASAVGSELKLCSSCGAVMQLNERICTMCGFNAETGRFVQAEHARRERVRRALCSLAVVVILGGTGGLAYRKGVLRKPTEWPRIFLPRPVAEEPSAPLPGAPVPPPRTEEQIAALAAAFENSLRMELDEKAPVIIRGEEIELVRTNGLSVTGVFRGLTHRGTALIEVDRVLQDIPLVELREASRVRVDEEFRNERIRIEARRRAETGRSE